MNRRIAIFGGSFDPPHNGHVSVVEKLAQMFDLCLVVPSFVSPFKENGASATAHDRLEMLKIALKSLTANHPNKIQLCDYEINSNSVSYTIDTIKHLKGTFKDDQLFIVIGQENLGKLTQWRDYKNLTQLAEFFVVPRAEFSALKIKGDMNVAPFAGSSISSSECKLALSFGKADGIMNDGVVDYIREKGLYNQYERFIMAYHTFCLSAKRIEHTYYSASYGIFLAKLYGVDVEKTVVALLVHDIAKTIAGTEASDDYILDKSRLSGLAQPVLHSELGAQIAQGYFGIDDEDILNSIRYHTTGRANMSQLEEVVFLADKLELSRTYRGVDKIRMLAKKSLAAAMKFSLASTVQKLNATNRMVSSLTIDALKYYKSRSRNGN